MNTKIAIARIRKEQEQEEKRKNYETNQLNHYDNMERKESS